MQHSCPLYTQASGAGCVVSLLREPTFAWLKPPLQIGPHLDGTIRSYNSSGMRQSQWIVSQSSGISVTPTQKAFFP